MKKTTAFTRLIKSALLLVSVTGFILVQGCSDSNNPDQVTSGLYKDGTASLDGGAIEATDLIGFVHDNRIMAFSVTSQILIDGTLSVPVVNDFTGTVDVYVNGLLSQADVSVTGQATTSSSLSLDLAGTGIANGNISLSFDSLYNRSASFAKLESSYTDTLKPLWIGVNYGINIDPNFLMAFDNVGAFSGIDGDSVHCIFDNGLTVMPLPQNNIYNLSLGVSEFTDCGGAGLGFTGLASVIDGANGTDSKFIYAFTIDGASFFGVLEK